MKYHELINTTLDSVTANPVYGDPYASDGVTIIPAGRRGERWCRRRNRS